MNKSMKVHYTLHAFLGFFFLLKSFKKTVFFWYTVRSPFGSINCDSLFTGKWASESLCGQSHLSSARGGAAAA